MKKSSVIVLIIAWILMGILCTGAGIHQTLHSGFDKSYLFFIMAAISFLMGWYRYKQLKKNA